MPLLGLGQLGVLDELTEELLQVGEGLGFGGLGMGLKVRGQEL